MRRWILVALLLPIALPPSASSGSDAFAVFAGRYQVAVDGETALGWVAYPTGAAPTTLLVFGHGCCGKPNQSAFVASYAAAYGAAVVAMDYRGPGGWDVMKGHRDLIAATVDLQARFPIARTVAWGISMGGETTGMAVAARPDLYDYWVDTFGVTNLFEEYATLGCWPSNPTNPAFCATASWIVQETGGTPATAPEAYAARSPVLMAPQMAGLTRAYIFHGIGDPIVPYTMSREMFDGLRAAGVPASLTTVLTRPGGTQTPYFLGGSLPTPVGPSAHEFGATTATTYQTVDALLRGLEPDEGTAWREHVVDYTTGQRADAP